jgi:hypothetical protein
MSDDSRIDILERRVEALQRLLDNLSPRLNQIDHPLQPVFLAKRDGGSQWHEQTIINGTVSDWPGGRTCTSNSDPSSLRHANNILLEIRDGADFRYVELLPAYICFYVGLQKTAGSAGDKNTECSFVYTVSDGSGMVIGTNIGILGHGNRIVNATMTPGTKGIALYQPNGALTLLWADERFVQTNCA